jgi:molybdenum cofactor guanylyltransferase
MTVLGTTVAGIFVGGRASRMGGIQKGRLPISANETIVQRSMRVLREAGVSSCVFVGREASTTASAVKGKTQPWVITLDDDRQTTGPLAGLLALLAHANSEKAQHAIAIACDMPFIEPRLVRKLLDVDPAAAIVAPKDKERRWQPFFARYDASVVLPLARRFADGGGRRLQDLFDRAKATVLELQEGEAQTLTDWDTIDDLPPHLRSAKTPSST